MVSQTVAALLHSADEETDDDVNDTDAQAWAAFSLPVDHGDEIDASVATAVSGRSLVLDASEAGYRVFATLRPRSERGHAGPQGSADRVPRTARRVHRRRRHQERSS